MKEWYQLKGQILKDLIHHLQTGGEIDQTREFFHSYTIRIPEISFINLACTLKNQTLCYFKNKDNSRQFLGIGITALFQYDNDFDNIQELLEENPALVFLGGQSFFNEPKIAYEWEDFGERFVFLPQVLAKCENQEYTFTFFYSDEILSSIEAQSRFIFQVEDILSFRPYLLENRFEFNQSLHEPGPMQWNDSVKTCTDEFREDPDFHKVVLAKKETYLSLKKINGLSLLKEMHQYADDSYCFYLQTSPHQAFLSISPERLFTLENDKIVVDCIAGTRARGKDQDEENRLSHELLTSEKEINEHRIVADEIFERLEYLCDQVLTPQKVSLLKCKYVQHLFAQYSGVLQAGVSLEKIIKILHPTPAVGGRPWHLAQDYIKNLEPFQRGFYAAPVGVVTSNYTEFAVGIRSCLINNKALHIYAGAGIVPGSIGQDEWIEVHNKMKNFLQIF